MARESGFQTFLTAAVEKIKMNRCVCRIGNLANRLQNFLNAGNQKFLFRFVIGRGGYVVAPPSPGYSVVLDAPLAEMPAWLVEACRKKPPPNPPLPKRALLDLRDAGARRLVALVEFVADAREGQRNSRLFWAACRAAEAVIAGEMPAGVAFMALEQAAVAIALPAVEARRTIQSARRTAHRSAAA
jgi:hypothetical protein